MVRRALVVVSAWAVCALGSCPAGTVPFPGSAGEACEAYDEAYSQAQAYLLANAPPWDLANAATLFGAEGGVDGLDDGVAAVGIHMALAAKNAYPWAAAVPKDAFLEYVVPYASANEPRTNWRPLLAKALGPALNDLAAINATLDDVAKALNGYGAAEASLWDAFGTPIKFVSGRTPLVFDAVSTVAFGGASCTGISMLYLGALRAAGIPARLAGTPAWRGNTAAGNHNWVEILRGDKWSFVEGKPAAGGETLDDPCDKWFCASGRFQPGDNATRVYAARFDAHANESVYPLAWDLKNQDVPGEDRSAYYLQACGQC
ncbi:hypothetical protein M885DRAFT_547317 [Pelagophyceae sp. CCMP2097]|nr:hypothetical protein M885DRAFT_547317 [Pelagophyceae sp. CCMP2097]